MTYTENNYECMNVRYQGFIKAVENIHSNACFCECSNESDLRLNAVTTTAYPLDTMVLPGHIDEMENRVDNLSRLFYFKRAK